MNYTRTLRKYFSLEKKHKRIDVPLMFKNQTDTINNLLLFLVQDGPFKRKSNLEFMNFIYKLEFKDESINEIIQELLYNLQKNFTYAGSSVLSAYVTDLWDKYEEIGLTTKLKEKDLVSFQKVAEVDCSSDIDLFFRDYEDAYIFCNIINFKLNEIYKFLFESKKLILDGNNVSRAFGDSPINENIDIIDFFMYQEPLYKVDIPSKIEKIQRNQGYSNLIVEKENSLITIKLNLLERILGEVLEFAKLMDRDIPSTLFDYNVTEDTKDLFNSISKDSYNAVLNCILPIKDARNRNRVPYFDVLNCALIWDLELEEFNTKFIGESSNYNNEVFQILVKPWEIIINPKYIQEHFQPTYKVIDRPISHLIDYIGLEEVLDFENPEEDIERLLSIDYESVPEAKRGNPFTSNQSRTIILKLLTTSILKMIPSNVDFGEVRMAVIRFKTYTKIVYNEPIIDKLLFRIKKYQEKGYLLNNDSNIIPILLTAKIDNVFNLFSSPSMVELLEESLNNTNQSIQEMILSIVHENSNNKRYTELEFKRTASNMETFTFIKDTIIKINELKKNNLLTSNLKSINYDNHDNQDEYDF